MDMAGNFVESRFVIDRSTVSGGRALGRRACEGRPRAEQVVEGLQGFLVQVEDRPAVSRRSRSFWAAGVTPP
jgi:hypothetical protein